MTNYEIVLKARLDEADKRIAELEKAIAGVIDHLDRWDEIEPSHVDYLKELIQYPEGNTDGR